MSFAMLDQMKAVSYDKTIQLFKQYMDLDGTNHLALWLARHSKFKLTLDQEATLFQSIEAELQQMKQR